MGMLADLFVQIRGDQTPLNQTLAKVHKQLMGFGIIGTRAGISLGQGMAAGFGVGIGGLGIAGLVATLAKSIHGASDLNETLNKMSVIFGVASFKVVADADMMAKKFGIVRTEFMDIQSQFGGLLQGMGGMTKDASAKTASDLSKLAADASSMFNVGFADAGIKIASALRGETEPIRSLNVDVSEAAVIQEAYRLKLVRVGQELNTQQKVTARTSLVFKGLRITLGDLENTQDGFGNASREVWGRISNSMATFGQAIIPVAERFVGGLNKMLTSLDVWVNASKGKFVGWSESVESAFKSVGWSIGEIGSAITGLGDRIAGEVGYQTKANGSGLLPLDWSIWYESHSRP